MAVASIILSMDVSGGAPRIRRAINDVAGIENVEVYPDTGRVVVTGWADATEVVSALERRLRVTVTIINSQVPKLEYSSDEDDSDDKPSSSADDCYYEQGQPSNLADWWPRNPTTAGAEWHDMGLPAIRTREPWAADQPVPDPSSWFFNFNLGDSSTPPEDDD